jgi:hypothetical protein
VTDDWLEEMEEEWNGEGWISFDVAIEEIRSRLGMSPGFAETKLREICASGSIRAIKFDLRPFLMFPEEPGPIGLSEWGRDMPDYIHPAVSSEDFRYWLNKQAPPPAPEPRSSQKRDQARQAVDALWPQGIPTELLNKQIEKEIGEWLKAKGLPEVSRDTILRAAGRK